MPIYKLVFNFIEASGATWSEVHHRTASTAAQAVVLNNASINARLAMLDNTAILRNIRAFNITSNRDSYTAVQNYAGTFKDTANIGPSPAGSAAVAAASVNSGRSVYHWMRGLPNALIALNSSTGFPNVPAALKTSLQAFYLQMGNSGCGSVTLQPTTKYQIIGLTFNVVTQTATLTYTVALGQTQPVWQIPQRVIIGLTSKKDLPGLNGHWSIVGATQATGTPLTGTVTIRYVVPNQQTTIASNGYIRSESYGTVNQYNGGSLAYYGTHSTKSVFSNSRGAKSAKRIRTLA